MNNITISKNKKVYFYSGNKRIYAGILSGDIFTIFRNSRTQILRILNNSIGISYDVFNDLDFKTLKLILDGESLYITKQKANEIKVVKHFSGKELQVFIPVIAFTTKAETKKENDIKARISKILEVQECIF